MASGGLTKASCLRRRRFRPTVAHATYRYSGRIPPASSRRRSCGGIWDLLAALQASTGVLILERASASRSSGEWQDEDYDVLRWREVAGPQLREATQLLRLLPHFIFASG